MSDVEQKTSDICGNLQDRIARELIKRGGGVYIHIFVLCPTNFKRN